MRMFFLVAGLLLAGSATAQTVTIQNNSSWDIYEMYISSVNTDSWGPDQLGRDIFQSGEYLQLNGVPCGDYDARIVDEDGDQCVLQRVRMCGNEQFVIDDSALLECQFDTSVEGSSQLAAARSPTSNVISVLNDSAWDINEFYLSTVHTNSWGPDQLGREILDSGEQLQLSGIPCGQYDALLIDEDGDQCILRRVTLCGSEQFVITSDDLLECQVDTEIDGYVDG